MNPTLSDEGPGALIGVSVSNGDPRYTIHVKDGCGFNKTIRVVGRKSTNKVVLFVSDGHADPSQSITHGPTAAFLTREQVLATIMALSVALQDLKETSCAFLTREQVLATIMALSVALQDLKETS